MILPLGRTIELLNKYLNGKCKTYTQLISFLKFFGTQMVLF